ncbi:putative metallocarboxypeptidase ecm14 [Taxawa tesnikishii (nom. ined.)]|nr:putative metallocarboxypeptidase ecm14 [Dothideales sp. JES 119]
MRVQSLLVAPALLSSLVAAVPSAFAPQEPFVQPHQPAWRIVSDRIIEKVWGLDDKTTSKKYRSKNREANAPPARASAQYGQDILLRFNISTAEEAKSLAEAANTLYLDVWEYNENWVDIRLAKRIVPSLLGLLPSSLYNAHTPILSERELVQAIYDTYPSPKTSTDPARSHRESAFTPSLNPTTQSEHNIFFSDYQPFSVIQPWLRLLSSLFTTHVRYITVGTTFEGRPIPGVRVGVRPANDNETPSPRKTILIAGGLHAREWISVSTVNYIAYSLITRYGKSAATTSLLENFDFVFIPTLNPDGYVFSWETDRLWRKNRQKTFSSFCNGLDLDRSFDFHWDGSATKGNPCSESYSGERAFEGVEALQLANWAKNETEKNNVEFVGLLDLHSYSQQILYPWAYSCDAEPPTIENLVELGLGISKSIRLDHGRGYQVAQACEGNVGAAKNERKKEVFPRFEAGGGSALDWFYHEMKVRYPFQIKLRDRGSYGFLLPKEHIVPTGREMLDAVLYFGRYLSEQYDVEKIEVKQHETLEKLSTLLGDTDVDEVRDDTTAKPDGDVMWELRRRMRR